MEYRLGGAYYELLKSKYSTTETIAFEDENHGFWSRGRRWYYSIVVDCVCVFYCFIYIYVLLSDVIELNELCQSFCIQISVCMYVLLIFLK